MQNKLFNNTIHFVWLSVHVPATIKALLFQHPILTLYIILVSLPITDNKKLSALFFSISQSCTISRRMHSECSACHHHQRLSIKMWQSSLHTHTHTRLTAVFSGLPGWAGTRKEKPIWILLKQETVSGSCISWAICKSAPRSRQITTPAPQPLCFLQAGCPSCHPTNSIKALKA